MIVKYFDNKLYTFEKSTGMTGMFSGKSLECLVAYSSRHSKTAFIDRLFELGILTPHSCLDEIPKALKKESSSLESLHIDITTACPLRCPQCYQGESKNCFMPFDKFQTIIQEAESLNIFQIAIGGGEALLHPELDQFITCVANTQMAVSLTTSGYQLTSKRIGELVEKGLNHIQISLNSIDERINEKSRDGYSEAVKAIFHLNRSGLSFGINTVVRKDNLGTLEETIQFARAQGADNINLLRYKPTSLELYGDFALNQQELKRLKKIIRKSKGIKIKLDSAFSNFMIDLNGGQVSPERIGCAAGRKFITITPDGSFKPCSHLPYREQAGSIQSYLEGSLFMKHITDPVFCENSDCASCLYRDQCRSCRAITEKDHFIIGEKNCIGFREKIEVSTDDTDEHR